MKDKVTILMATYNGEKFIRKQIESILCQTYKNFQLIIRDDGSKDNTIKIISELVENDNRIELIVGNNLGQKKNFNELLKIGKKSKYIMFADQDDIWLENKVEISLNEIKKYENIHGEDEPILVYTKLRYVDENLNLLKIKKINNTENSINTLLGYNYIWGCTMIINHALANISFPIGEYSQNHDYWIALCASINGEIVHLNEETILYRQHSNNVTGGINNYSIINKIKRIGVLFKSYEQQVKQNIEFCEKNTNNSILNDYLSMCSSSGINKVKKIWKIGLRRNTKKDSIIYYFYLIFILNKGREI